MLNKSIKHLFVFRYFYTGNAGHKSTNSGSGGHKSNSKNSQESILDIKPKKQQEKPLFSTDTINEDLESGSGDGIDTDEEDGHIPTRGEDTDENGDGDGDLNIDNTASGNKVAPNSGEDDLTTEIDEKIPNIDDISSKLKQFYFDCNQSICAIQNKFGKKIMRIPHETNLIVDMKFIDLVSFLPAVNFFVHHIVRIEKKIMHKFGGQITEMRLSLLFQIVYELLVRLF